jgi:hypothetical protein
VSSLAGALVRALALVASLSLLPSTTDADDRPPAIALHWVRDQGAESCVSGHTLTRELAQLVEHRPAASAGELSIEGMVRREPSRWVARLRVLDAQGQTTGVREVESSAPDCAALTPPILLVLAWLSELSADAEPANAAPSPSEAPELPPALAPARGAATPAPKRWAIEPSLGLGIAFGVNPSTSFGPMLGVQLSTPWRLIVALAGHYWLPDRVALKQPAVPGSSVTFQAVQASLALCVPFLPPGAWTLAGCWGGLLGSRFTHARGLTESPNPARLYGGVIDTLRLGYGVASRWSLTLDATGAAFGREDRFVYQNANGETRELFRPPRFGGWCTAGVAARF